MGLLLLVALQVTGVPSAWPSSFPVAGVSYFLAMEKFRKETIALLEKDCVPPVFRSSFGDMLGQLGESQKALAEETDSFMGAVSAPMPGNGKCDGGFEAVASESELRRLRTMASLAKWKSTESGIESRMRKAFANPDLAFDVSNGESCADEAEKAFNALKDSAVGLKKVVENVNASLLFEASRFSDYRERNRQLQARCGQLKPGDELQKLIGANGSAAPPAPPPAGASANGRSDVTGIKEDAVRRSGDGPVRTAAPSPAPATGQGAGPLGAASDPSLLTGKIIAKLDAYSKAGGRQSRGGGKLPMGAPSSAGSVLWDIPADASPGDRLVMSKELKLAPGGAPAVEAAGGVAGPEAYGRGPAGVAGPSEDPQSGAGAELVLASRGPAQAGEPDLFQRIRARYRALELFRSPPSR